MHSDNRQWEYLPSNGYSVFRNECPPRFAPYYGQLQMPNGPSPQCPHPHSTRCNSSRDAQESFGGNQHSSSFGYISPRKRGPHTPPGPPPDDQPSSVSYNSLSKYSNKNDNFMSARNTSRWQLKHHSKRRAYQSQYQRNQHCNIRGRRTSLSLSQLGCKRKSLQTNGNAKEDHSSDRDTSTSVLNSAVQSYLLQVLTTQPPPSVLPTPYDQMSSTLSTFSSKLIHNDSQARPPLPPTPVRPQTPPPPPSDEENWDTPSEESNEGSNGLSTISANHEKLLHFEGHAESTFSTAPVESSAPQDLIGNAFQNENHLANMHSKAEHSAVGEKTVRTEQGDSKEKEIYNSFKIKLPTRSIQQTANVVDNVANESLNTYKNYSQSFPSELTIVIPNSDNQNLCESILKIVTPKNNIQNVQENAISKEKIVLRASPPNKDKIQNVQMEIFKDIAEETTIGKSKVKRRKTNPKEDYPAELVEKVLRVEEELSKNVTKENVLILKFPDPPLSHKMVKEFCKDIATVHFQQNIAPRFCFVHLKNGADVEKSIKELCKIPFGNGTIKAEIKNASSTRTYSTKANNIDPFTLYVGNLSTTLPCKVLKERFPGATRICVGFARRMKCTRYAFVQYQTVEDSIAAFRRMYNCEIEGRSLIIRFKRLGSVAVDEDNQTQGNDDSEDRLHANASYVISSPIRMACKRPGSVTADECVQMNDNDDNVNLKKMHISSAISSQESKTNMTEDIELRNDHSNRKENNILQNVSKENINVFHEDSSEETNLQDVARRCEIYSPNDNQLVASMVKNKNCINVLTTENLIETNSQLKYLDNINLRIISYKETNGTTSGMNQPVAICDKGEKQSSATQTESNADVEVIEIASVERNENSNSNTVMTERLDYVRGVVEVGTSCSAGSVKSEQTPHGTGDTENVAFNVPNQHIKNLKNGTHCVNKFERNEDFEFFSDRTSQTSSSSVDASTVQSSATNSHTSVSTISSPNSSGPALETIMPTISEQSQNQKEEKQRNLSKEPAEDSNGNFDLRTQVFAKNTNLASIQQNARICCTTHIAHDDIGVSRQSQSHKVSTDCVGTDDDLVPTNALLLRRYNKLATNDVNQTEAQELHVKQEPIEICYPKSDLEKTSQKEKSCKLITKTSINCAFRKRRAPSSQENFRDVKPLVPCVVEEDDDDLVPANCALNMFQKSEHVLDLTHDNDNFIEIKREAETQDLYSLPARTNDGMRQTKLRNSNNSSNVATSNRRRSSSSNCRSFGMPPNCEDDNDVIIISDTLTRAPQQIVHISQDLFYTPKESFHIKREDFSATNTEKSLFDKGKRPTKHRDNLDRLFALLNSNSDDEL